MLRHLSSVHAAAAARTLKPSCRLVPAAVRLHAATSLRAAHAASATHAASRVLCSAAAGTSTRTTMMHSCMPPLPLRSPARQYQSSKLLSAPSSSPPRSLPAQVWGGVKCGTRLFFRWGGRGLLIVLVGGFVYGLFLMRNEEDKSWQLMVWKTLPLRFLSHVWGSVHRLTLPVWARRPVYMWWTRTFNCRLDEMEGGPECLEDFPNLNSFFIRRIDLARVRPLDPAEMVSPVDGRVNCFGEVRPGGLVDQIKGMSYRVEDLLGHPLPKLEEGERMYYYVLYLAPGDYHRMHAPFDCVVEERRHFPGALYPVAPSIAKYIPSLFVRNERVVLSGTWGADDGSNSSGNFMALVPVGAYNVGSMKLTFDEGLDTNLREHTFTQYRPNLDDGLQSQPFYRSYKQGEVRPLLAGKTPQYANEGAKDTPQQRPVSTQETDSVAALQRSVVQATDEFVKTDPAIDPHTFDSSAQGEGKQGADGMSAAQKLVPGAPAAQVGQPVFRVDSRGIHLPKGSEFSRFELGSTIVVLFQLGKGKTFNFNVECNQKIKLGQKMGVIIDEQETRVREAAQQAEGHAIVIE